MQRDTPTLKGDLIGCAKDVEYPFCNNQSNSVSDLDVSAFTPEKRRNLSPAFQIYPKALFHPLLWKLATNFGSFSAISADKGCLRAFPEETVVEFFTESHNLRLPAPFEPAQD